MSRGASRWTITLAALLLGAATATAGPLGPKSGAYQAYVHMSCPYGTCKLVFPQVPSGKVLQVGRVSCTAVTGGQLYEVMLQSTIAGDAPLMLRSVLVAKETLYNFSTWSVGENVTHYLSPLAKPTIALWFDTKNNSADCTVTGLLVSP